MKRLLAGIVVVVVLGGLAAGAWWLFGGGTTTAPVTFALPNLQGKTQHAAQWRGKVVALNFWASWCAPCRHEIPMLVQAQKDHAGDGLQIIGLAVDKVAPVRRFASKYGINYPVLVDPVRVARLQDRLKGGTGLPATIILDRSGHIRKRVSGALTRDHFERLVAPLLDTR